MIVLKDFYCLKTKKNWKQGQKYTGKRKDLKEVLISEKDFEKLQAEKAEKNKKIEEADKKRVKSIGQFGTAKHKEEKPKKK